MCISVMEGWYMQYLGPGCGPLHRHVLTLGKILDLYVETPATGQPEPILWLNGPNLGFPCSYVLNKPKQRKKSIGQPSYGESYSGDLRGPRSRVSPVKDHRSVGIAGKLACVPNICV